MQPQPFGIPAFIPRGTYPPVSNTERQRQFRQRNPDYYRLLQAKRRAPIKAARAARRAAQHALAAEARAAVRTPLALPAPIMTIPLPTRLALPAPVEELILPALQPLHANQPVRVLIERSQAA